MTERTDGQKVVDIFVETARANAAVHEARELALRDAAKSYDRTRGVLADYGLSPSDAVDLAHGTAPDKLFSEVQRFERKTSRPSLLEVAQIAFGVSAGERVSAVIDGRPMTVRSLNPLPDAPAIVVPNRAVAAEDMPTEVTGEFAYTTLNLSSLVMEADTPVFDDADSKDDETPISQSASRTVQVFPVRRTHPLKNTFEPQVDITIRER